MRHPIRGILATLLTAALLAGCGDDAGEGTIVLHLTDAPFPFDLIRSTEVVIDSVTVHGVGDDGFLTVDRTQRTIDLLELRNGVSMVLGSALVPAGSVDQIRVYVGDATVTLTDDRAFQLRVPSGSSSGVKVFPSPAIEIGDGGTVDVLIDFDLSSSFSARPSSPQRVDEISSFSFHPVLRVANLVDVGAISGTVRGDAGSPGDPGDDIPLANATIAVSQAGTDITSSASDVNGRDVLMGLPPGEYTVAASMPEGFASDSTSVTVEAARETAGTDLLLAETP